MTLTKWGRHVKHPAMEVAGLYLKTTRFQCLELEKINIISD